MEVEMENESTEFHPTTKLSDDEMTAIKNFLHGAVFCWCRNCKEDNGDQKWFSLHDLIGEATSANWKDTPLIKLFDWYRNNSDYGESSAKHTGKILKQLLDSNEQIFYGEKDGAWQYMWNGE